MVLAMHLLNASVQKVNSTSGSTSLQLIASGFTVFATLLPHEGRDHLSSEGIQVFNADVTSDKEVADLLSTITSISHGRLDMLVNNAYTRSSRSKPR